MLLICSMAISDIFNSRVNCHMSLRAIPGSICPNLANLAEGRSRSQIMEWMLVTDEILVARYCEREYIVTSFVAKMFD